MPPGHLPGQASLSSGGSQNLPVRQTAPAQYRTGTTIGSGTYTVVKEAVNIKTGKYYACKIFNKKVIGGREYLMRNEIAVLKRISGRLQNKNIMILCDYFETKNNFYFVFDICIGGTLFDHIRAEGKYLETDAANLIRTIMTAVAYIHDFGIVHRDLKPKNLLFRDKREDAHIMITDFGLSGIMDEENTRFLTYYNGLGGTSGYSAPEIHNKLRHGKPVDIWAMGVITFFLLCGYTPFSRDSKNQESQAVVMGDYTFEPGVSEMARSFIKECLSIDPKTRPAAKQALEHGWFKSEKPHSMSDVTGDPKPAVQITFNGEKAFHEPASGLEEDMERLSMDSRRHQSHRAEESRSSLSSRKWPTPKVK